MSQGAWGGGSKGLGHGEDSPFWEGQQGWPSVILSILLAPGTFPPFTSTCTILTLWRLRI